MRALRRGVSVRFGNRFVLVRGRGVSVAHADQRRRKLPVPVLPAAGRKRTSAALRSRLGRHLAMPARHGSAGAGIDRLDGRLRYCAPGQDDAP
jgi:hypothetical protein